MVIAKACFWIGCMALRSMVYFKSPLGTGKVGAISARRSPRGESGHILVGCLKATIGPRQTCGRGREESALTTSLVTTADWLRSMVRAMQSEPGTLDFYVCGSCCGRVASIVTSRS